MKKKLKYAYADKVCVSVKAEVVGQELERLVRVNKGVILPDTVLRSAKPKRSPIHNCFEWNDRKAAQAYRLEQARYLLRAVIVIETDPRTKKLVTCRAFPSIVSEGGTYYTTIAHVMDDPELYENLSAQIARNLEYWRDKGRHLPEFERVWKAIDTLKV